MTRVHVNVPKVFAAEVHSLEESRKICLPCLMLVRGEQLMKLRDETMRYLGDGADHKSVYLSHEPKQPLREAVTYGVCVEPDLSHLGLIQVCWDHLAGVDPNPPKPEEAPPRRRLFEANGALPPGLTKGQGPS